LGEIPRPTPRDLAELPISGVGSATRPLREAMESETTQSLHPLLRRIVLDLFSWRTQARNVENEREPRSSQDLNIKSDELRDSAFQQTRVR